MSWKRSVCAGLLCVVASPVFAVPTLSLVKGGTEASGHLDSQGRWVWVVQITPTGAGSPLAAELGFRETADADVGIVSASKNATNFDTDNPGTLIFGWEDLTDLDPGPGVNNKPVGLQTNIDTDEIFSALGSIDFATAGAKEYITVVLDAPQVTSAEPSSVTTIQWLGKYGAGGVNGRIAEVIDGNGVNFDIYAGSATRTALGGDVNLDGMVSIADYGIFQNNFGESGKFWYQGDFNRDGNVSIFDYSIFQNNYQTIYTVGPDAGAGAGFDVVQALEPSSNILAAPVLPGDYNDDGAVDDADYVVWRNTLGQVGFLAADGNGNGQIDDHDYQIWRVHFSQTAGSAATVNTAVPEPATLPLLVAGMLATLARRRKEVS